MHLVGAMTGIRYQNEILQQLWLFVPGPPVLVLSSENVSMFLVLKSRC